ncbi:hypothetical protein LC55x_1120 [Lysobacter capsici]|nr:hypothetical protein LC55x_1120 [Lysobacter capsici]
MLAGFRGIRRNRVERPGFFVAADSSCRADRIRLSRAGQRPAHPHRRTTLPPAFGPNRLVITRV